MVTQPVRDRQKKPNLPAGRAERDDAVARLDRAAGIVWRPDLPILTDDELRREIAEAWARDAEGRDRRAAAP